MLNLLRKSAARRELGRVLEEQLSVRARAPVFYAELGVPDTVDGRFEMVTLHAWMALAQLKAANRDTAAQALIDAVFVGFEEALREQGAGDMALGRRMKAIANAFYGRLAAYGGAVDGDALAQALAHNVWRGGAVDGNASALAAYVMAARAALESSKDEALDFGPLPQTVRP